MKDNEINYELQMFMDALFGKRRLLIVKVNTNKNSIIRQLKDYCDNKALEFFRLEGKNLKADDIKGEWDVIWEGGVPYSRRKKPEYISDKHQMIAVENLDEDTELETLTAFMYMGSLGAYYDDIENLPKDKLPYGSAFVFIAENDFPLARFASISSYWNDESAVIDLRDFQTRVKEHMGEYKRNTLNIKEDGLYIYKNKAYSLEHILPKDKEKINILEKYRSEFFTSIYAEKIKFHKYFHHLNSSQAMCINFFYPLIKENELQSVLDIIGIKGKISNQPLNIVFEKESDIEENSDRRTNFDFYTKLDTGIKLYFEIKYTENEFGNAANDEEHKKKFQNTYLPIMKDNPAIRKSFKTEDIFLKNYQIMRNLVHISEDSYVVFIFPNKNIGIKKAALSAKEKFIEDRWKNHFILLTWENLVEQIKYHLKSKELIEYYSKDFTSKYLEF